MEQKKMGALAAAGALIVLGAAYLGAAQRYKQTFFPRTVFNGVAVGGMTAEEAKESLTGSIRSYVLKIGTRTGEEEIAGADIGLHAEFDGEAESILAGQNPYLWGIAALTGSNYEIRTAAVFDEEKLTEALDALTCMNAASMEAPENAYLSEYIEGKGYEIIPEKAGTTLDASTVYAAAAEAVGSLKTELSLEDAGAYAAPEITAQDPDLLARCEEMNRYAAMTVTYLFGSQKEVLEGIRLQSWLSQDASGAVTVDEEQIAAYIKELADRYDTAYKPKEFLTSYGTTVTIDKGNYGWQIDQKAETAALRDIILSGQGQVREPVYRQTAASRDGADYGNTYVEVNLTAQHLFFYVNGQLVIESDFVSGNEARRFSTPAGAYPVTYKQRNAVLRGQGYASPVSYWMPFNRGIGLHDASWRGSFGGSLYKTGGSHGCVNLPTNVARTIYESIQKGDPVLCYHLAGTETTATTRGSQYAYVEFHRDAAAGETQAALAAAKPVNRSTVAEPAAVSAVSDAVSEPAAAGAQETEPEASVEETIVQAGSQETLSGSGGSRVITAGGGRSRDAEETAESQTSAVIEQGSGLVNAGPGQTQAESVLAETEETAAESASAGTAEQAAEESPETAAPETPAEVSGGPGAAETQAAGPANEIHINTAQTEAAE